eukprot:m.147160 g.147160  ORF g.147160 m.147160 type:complete len:306 (-) comp17780_c0_seq1:320-1237(-)
MRHTLFQRCIVGRPRSQSQRLAPACRRVYAGCRAMTTCATQHHASVQTSIDPEEIQRFRLLADKWWDPHGEFKHLQLLNRARLKYIRRVATEHFFEEPEASSRGAPLEGISVLDVGCGGGLLAEPLACLGAHVMGLDAVELNVHVASQHASQNLMADQMALSYTCGTVEEVVREGSTYDLVVASEVVEHVADVGSFVQSCADAVNTNGLLIFSTLNRTFLSYAAGIVVAEDLLHMAPQGTHTHEKFVTPTELSDALARAGFHMHSATGMRFSPRLQQWYLADADLNVNYIVAAHRAHTQSSSEHS